MTQPRTPTAEARYTGAWHEDGSSDCSATPPVDGCQYEDDTTCHHCQTPVREHVDEDGSYRLTEPRATPTADLVAQIEKAVRELPLHSSYEGQWARDIRHPFVDREAVLAAIRSAAPVEES